MSDFKIIKNVTLSLAEMVKGKLQKVNGKVPDVSVDRLKDFSSDNKKPLVHFYLYKMEENTSLKETQKTTHQQTNKKGELFEFFLDPPIFLNLYYMVTCLAQAPLDEYIVMGQVAKIFLENSILSAETMIEKDALYSDEKITIKLLPPLAIETQVKLWQVLGATFRPSLFYQVTVKLSSEKKTGFRRVVEREIRLKEKKPS